MPCFLMVVYDCTRVRARTRYYGLISTAFGIRAVALAAVTARQAARYSHLELVITAMAQEQG
jgi:hypothetical protein